MNICILEKLFHILTDAALKLRVLKINDSAWITGYQIKRMMWVMAIKKNIKKLKKRRKIFFFPQSTLIFKISLKKWNSNLHHLQQSNFYSPTDFNFMSLVIPIFTSARVGGNFFLLGVGGGVLVELWILVEIKRIGGNCEIWWKLWT